MAARQRQLGLPTLFTTIIVGTLASGQFLAASLMSWMMAFWRYRHRAAQFRLRGNFSPRYSSAAASRACWLAARESRCQPSASSQATTSSSKKAN